MSLSDSFFYAYPVGLRRVKRFNTVLLHFSSIVSFRVIGRKRDSFCLLYNIQLEVVCNSMV